MVILGLVDVSWSPFRPLSLQAVHEHSHFWNQPLNVIRMVLQREKWKVGCSHWPSMRGCAMDLVFYCRDREFADLFLEEKYLLNSRRPHTIQISMFRFHFYTSFILSPCSSQRTWLCYAFETALDRAGFCSGSFCSCFPALLLLYKEKRWGLMLKPLLALFIP